MNVQVLILVLLLGVGLCRRILPGSSGSGIPISGSFDNNPWSYFDKVVKCSTTINKYYGCYEDTMQLQCSGDFPYIKIVDAFYGRPTAWWPLNCPPSDYQSPCLGTVSENLEGHAKTIVQGICDGESSCSAHVKSPEQFPEACHQDYRNLLYVEWKCCNEFAFKGCQKRVTKRVNHAVSSNCRSIHPLYVAECHGGCSSSAKIIFPGLQTTPSEACKCCRPRTSTYTILKVFCQFPSSFSVEQHSVDNIDECICEDCQ